MDYTPGAMRNATQEAYRPINDNPMSKGTRCAQLAMYVVFEAPIQMLADNPTTYMREQECTDFITGIPTTFTINIDQLPKIQLGVDPVSLNLSIKELPSMRVHLPADFRVGLSLFGIELANVRLCGQAMAINEPYKPNPCEICGPRSADQEVSGLPRLALGDG